MRGTGMPKFTIQGREFDIDVKDVEKKGINLEPAPITKKTFTIELSGKIFPIRQIVVALTGLPENEIDQLEAYKVLMRLGYYIKRARVPGSSGVRYYR
jgi:hypothetical protein